MEELLNQFCNSVTEVCRSIEDIVNVISKPNLIVTIINILVPSIFTILGTWIGGVIAHKNEKRKFLWECHINFLEIVNKFLSDIRDIIKELVDLEKLPALMLKETNEKVDFKNWKDFNSIANDIIEMSKTIKNLDIDEKKYPIIYSFKEQYIKKSYDVIYFDKFSDICSEYERNAAKYYHLISENLVEKSKLIVSQIEIATQNNMTCFDIQAFKLQLIDFVRDINHEIDLFKIRK